jgi:hypothetical protein
MKSSRQRRARRGPARLSEYLTIAVAFTEAAVEECRLLRRPTGLGAGVPLDSRIVTTPDSDS